MDLKNNKHLKEVQAILDNWDEQKGWLTTNDIGGVDLVSEIDLKKLGFQDIDEEEILDALELHYDGSDYYFSRDYHGGGPSLIASSSEEIFITYENELYFPDRDKKNIKLSNDNWNTEVLAYSLQWMHESGIFPSIYKLDYYGNSPTIVKFHEWEDYKRLSSDDKKQFEEVERLVDICDLIKNMNESTYTIGDLPKKFYDALPQVIKQNDGTLEIMEVGNFDPYTLEITFRAEDMEEEDLDEVRELISKGTLVELPNGYDFKITISLLSNAIRFIKGLDDTLGLVT